MLNNIGLPGLLLIAVVVLVLFGRGKVSSLMGEVGKGITAFKRGVNDGAKDVDDSAQIPRAVPGETVRPTVADPLRPEPLRPVPGETARDVTPPRTTERG
ncbi:Sec-independent protein translocase TatA [Paracoccus sediminis]|uniref:Sec-independent protein translocase protein TatA n=1 Tax=Paracoccus sediminis TaxID=1214787 RepID=A0A238UWP6_9RHOB|nr:twin-arginine translocase TatA/TatE family subunit [Paracoccus sediminis]TBN52687.1 Sec-independent protein translocase TatA [Paracoccus sediminis]SNR26655.1 sec-independent protein translocase protein TatA [Paracoccus sediminis]